MATIGIIGSGNIGAAVARLAVAAHIEVVIANSRGPQSLAELVESLGQLATAGTVEEAARAGQATLLSVPLTAYADLPTEQLAGRIVLDTGNYYPFRDGRIPELDSNEKTTTERNQLLLPGARLVKAFSNILAHHIPELARPVGATDRSALPIAGDDSEAKRVAAELIQQLGFDTVDAGNADQSWQFEPETTAYTKIYLADPDTPFDQMQHAPASAVSASELRAVLAESTRIDVGARTF